MMNEEFIKLRMKNDELDSSDKQGAESYSTILEILHSSFFVLH